MEQEKKVVWIACRVSEACTGNQAEMLGQLPIPSQGGMGGQLNADQGGRIVRYRCLSCGGVFQIAS